MDSLKRSFSVFSACFGGFGLGDSGKSMKFELQVVYLEITQRFLVVVVFFHTV